MPRLNAARPGQRVQVRGRQIGFSFWPSRPGRRHRGLQSRLFALDPWRLFARRWIRSAPYRGRGATRRCNSRASRGLLHDGHRTRNEAAQPLALYYSYMNLSKTFCLTRGARTTFDQAQHGTKERLRGQRRGACRRVPGCGPDFAEQSPEFRRTPCRAGRNPADRQTNYDLAALLPQILSGHRLWAQGARKVERFIAIHDLQFWQDTAAHTIWLRIYLLAEDLYD